MDKPEGIAKFVRYKQQVEELRPKLTADSRLITIDGPDGVGKSIIAQLLFEKLKQQLGEDRVVLVATVNFTGGPNQERLAEIIKSIKSRKPEDVTLDRFFVAAVNRTYGEEVIPALEDGKVVIIDRSEVDGLRYVMETKDQEAVKQRKRYIQEGTITHRLWAGHRIFVETDPSDIWENLSERTRRSEYDPKSLEEVKRRIKAEKQAEEAIKQMEYVGSVNVISVENQRVVPQEERENHLEKLVYSIIKQLDLT